MTPSRFRHHVLSFAVPAGSCSASTDKVVIPCTEFAAEGLTTSTHDTVGAALLVVKERVADALSLLALVAVIVAG